MLRLNPIIKKDMKVKSRSMKTSWGLFAYEAILGLIFAFFMFVLGLSGSFDNSGYSEIYKYTSYIFPTISISELVMIALIMPIMTASAISGEKEKQTFDILLTTPISSMSIIWGKLGSAVVTVMTFIIASIPIMAISFIIGGMKWSVLFIYLAAAFVFCVFTGSVGILASTMTKKSITAIILSYVFYFVYYNVASVMISITAALYSTYTYSVGSKAAPITLICLTVFVCLFNPVAVFVDFYAIIYNSGDGMMAALKDEIPQMPVLFNDVVLVIIAFILMLVMAFLITLIAAAMINPIRGYKDKSGGVQPSMQIPMNNPAQQQNMNAGMQNMNAGMQNMNAGMQQNGPEKSLYE